MAVLPPEDFEEIVYPQGIPKEIYLDWLKLNGLGYAAGIFKQYLHINSI